MSHLKNYMQLGALFKRFGLNDQNNICIFVFELIRGFRSNILWSILQMAWLFQRIRAMLWSQNRNSLSGAVRGDLANLCKLYFIDKYMAVLEAQNVGFTKYIRTTALSTLKQRQDRVFADELKLSRLFDYREYPAKASSVGASSRRSMVAYEITSIHSSSVATSLCEIKLFLWNMPPGVRHQARVK